MSSSSLDRTRAGAANATGAVAALLMACVGGRAYLETILTGWGIARGTLFPKILYSRTVITPNYFDLGFVRRGLGGTVAHVLNPDFVTSSAMFDAVSIALLVSALGTLVACVARTGQMRTAAYLGLVAALSPQTFLGWSRDPARTDVLVIGLVAWAAVATLHDRRRLGVTLLLVGYLAHETAIIFGGPVLFVLNARAVLQARISRAQGLHLLVLLGAALAGLSLLQSWLAPPPDAVAAYMFRNSFPGHTVYDEVTREIAVYMTVTGLRGLKTAVCWNLDYNPQHAITVLFAVAVLAAYVVILPLRRRLLSFGIACVLPLLFMVIIANDTGRWLKMAVLNVWLLAAALAISEKPGGEWGRRPMAFGAGLLAVLLLMGSTPFNHVNRLTHRVTHKLGFHDPGSHEGWMFHCDPNWRQVINSPHQGAGILTPELR